MVFYECVVTAKNTSHFHQLTSLVQKIAVEVVENGGIVRAVHNHGIRDLPHRFKAKYADKLGTRYYTKGRFFSIYYDSNPQIMKGIEQILRMDEEILRSTHLKARSKLDYINVMKEKYNPYLRRASAKMMERQQQKAGSVQEENNNNMHTE